LEFAFHKEKGGLSQAKKKARSDGVAQEKGGVTVFQERLSEGEGEPARGCRGPVRTGVEDGAR